MYGGVDLFKDTILENTLSNNATKIDVLKLEFSNRIDILPTRTLLCGRWDLNIADSVDYEILHIVISEIYTRRNGKVNLMLVGDRIRTVIMKYTDICYDDITSHEITKYIQDVERILNDILLIHIDGYYDIRNIEIIDNVQEVDKFYLITSFSLVVDSTDFVFGVDLLLYDRWGNHEDN